MEANSKTYTVLARRFRPQTFGEVVGQGHVAQALKNAIQSGRVAHAYLFTGARGVGKTSMARILAKALNCPNTVDGEPCNACEICDGITSGQDVDVSEIDGASNRGIDDIRTLRANVNVKSMRTKHKMYIIDEVHMLTKEAFNALLKTLEEPPPNVKFVFATTEPNKVPDTILSRCQRFDFGTIETANIIGRLQQIAEIEGYQVDPEALELVARRAAGSMRDSQSIFDQLLAFGQERLTADDVHKLLGTANDERLIELVDSLISHSPKDVLAVFDKALADGVQLSELFDQLLGYVRDLMVLAADAHGVGLLAVSELRREKLAEQAGKWGLATVVAALQILSDTKTKLFRSTAARPLAEMALVRIAILDDLENLSRLISELRQQPSGGGQAPLAPRPASAGSAPQKPTAPSGPVAPPTVSRPRTESAETPPANGDSSRAIPQPGVAQITENGQAGVVENRQDSPAQAAPSVEFRVGNESAIWSQVTAQIKDMLRDHVKNVTSVAISGPNQLDLFFPRSYHFSQKYCERSEVRSRLEKFVHQVTGRTATINFRIVETTEPEKPVAEVVRRPAASDLSRKVLENSGDPYVEQAKAIFGATIAKRDMTTKTTNPEESGGDEARG
ncbi:MAG: DNA polymerase III subunit gamma/tau [Planctomycetaceae bacterium]